jgi:hypothetical protein
LHFKEILSRITGVSVPIFGIQWQPAPLQVKVARDLMRELEDKRVLYRPEAMESAQYCVQSVIDMRQKLTTSMQQVDTDAPLYKQLQKIRRACRGFCDVVGSPKFDAAPFPVQSSLLGRELARFRQTVGGAVGAVSIAYGLEVEDELASIIPFNIFP